MSVEYECLLTQILSLIPSLSTTVVLYWLRIWKGRLSASWRCVDCIVAASWQCDPHMQSTREQCERISNTPTLNEADASNSQDKMGTRHPRLKQIYMPTTAGRWTLGIDVKLLLIILDFGDVGERDVSTCGIAFSVGGVGAEGWMLE